MKLHLDLPGCKLYHGDCARIGNVLRMGSIDSIVTDPPAGIGFMGKEWDSDRGGRNRWIAWMADRMKAALRVLKPGGHALVWALPRTSHWTALAIENAGFEIRDVHHHLFGSGFPKSLDVDGELELEADVDTRGMGTALKPAVEHWVLARKPLDGTLANNVLQHGTGGLNIDTCRIGNGRPPTPATWSPGTQTVYALGGGRWPAHLSLQHGDQCVLVREGSGAQIRDVERGARPGGFVATGADVGSGPPNGPTYDDDDDWQCVDGCPVAELNRQSGISPPSKAAKYAVQPNDSIGTFKMPLRHVEVPAREGGGASRFFYVAKPSRREKELGLGHLQSRSGGEATGRKDGSDGLASPRAGAGRGGGRKNFHPTVKSISLMRWLCRLITPPGGIVLDMFAGSGSTGVAALLEGFAFVGVEENKEYLPIIEGRLRHTITTKEGSDHG